jgi:hypothetical protein
MTALSAAIFANSLKAQVKNSVYSMFGVGQIIDHSYGVNKSMGGTGIAFQSGTSMNYLNPASYLGVLPQSFNVELGVSGIYNRAENRHTYQSDGDINVSFFSASPYLKNWWAFCFGIAPFSSIGYEINSSDEVGGELTTFEKNFKGSGGLSRAYAGNSFKIYKGLALGFNASYIFGLFTQTETAVSDDDFAGYELKNKRSAGSFYLDYGLQYSIKNKNWLYTIGLIYGDSKELSTTDEREFTYNETTSSLEADDKSSIRIPRKIGIGFSVKKEQDFRAGFDYEWKNWAAINFNNPYLNARNSNRFSMGLEYSHAPRYDWLNRIFFRVGANYQSSYLEVKNIPINSKGMNIGVGIPFSSINTINLSIEYGEEGTLDKKLIKNNYWQFYLSFSIHEFWLKRSY